LNILQEKVYGGSEHEYYGSLLFTEESIYIATNSSSDVSGNKTSGFCNENAQFFTFNDVWMLKLNYDLSIVWDRNYGGNYNDNINSLTLLPNGNILISAYSNSSQNTGNRTSESYDVLVGNQLGAIGDVWILVIQPDGEIVYQTSFGGTKFENGDIIKGNNNDYILCASSNSPISGNKTVGTWGDYDAWLAKVNMSEILGVSELSAQTFSVYPNPAGNILFVSQTASGNASFSSFQIIDLLGNEVKTGAFSKQAATQQIDVSGLNAGMYILQLDTARVKFLKE
jgi:hypothetical protein